METSPRSILYEGTDEHLVSGACVHTRIEEQAARTPDRPAIVDAHRSWSYRQMQHDSDLIGEKLQKMGIRKGDVVGSYMPHCAEYVLANLGIFKAGAAIFPLETNYPPELLSELIEMASIKFILSVDELSGSLPEGFTPGTGRCFNLDDGWAAQLVAESLPPLDDPKLELTDVAYVTMTSGSTGKPKGIVNAHLSAVCDFVARIDMLPYSEGDREACNVFFAWESLRPLLAGYPLYIIPDVTILDPKKARLRFCELRALCKCVAR